MFSYLVCWLLVSFQQVRFVYMLGVLAHCFIWAGEVCFRTFVNVACLCCVFLILGFVPLRNLPSRLDLPELFCIVVIGLCLEADSVYYCNWAVLFPLI